MSHEDESPLPEFDPALIVDLDVRPLIASGTPPMATIMTAVNELARGQVLHLRSPFMPGPMVRKLAGAGFSHRTHSFADDDWSTWFWRADEMKGAEYAAAPPKPEGRQCPADAAVMDLRLLPPPEPMLRILERVERETAAFEVLLPFYPEPLVPILEEMGRAVTVLDNRSDGVLVRVGGAHGGAMHGP
jgi:uncharacterized protein (DUF2249 family)